VAVSTRKVSENPKEIICHSCSFGDRLHDMIASVD
jgi:hypothetical protein